MLKFINYSNHILCTGLLCSFLLLTGCYDDTHILESLKNQQEQIDELKDMCARYNTSIEALQAVVSALQTKDYVTDVTPINQGSEIVGYTITFEKSGSVSIYNGKDGADGVDGHTPVIGVDQWTDGLWYWTIDGDWLLDSEGNMIRAVGTDGTDGKDGADGADGSDGKDGFTPVLKIENGYWYVSYDGGKTYGKDPVGQATGDNGYTMFDEVTYDEDYVYVTMNDGVTLKLPRATEDDMVNTYAGVSITVMSRDLTDRSIVLYGKVLFEDNVTADEFGVVYSLSDVFNSGSAIYVPVSELNEGDYSLSLSNLKPITTYYCATYIKQGDLYEYGDKLSFTTLEYPIDIPEIPYDINMTSATDLSSSASANCYIISDVGVYKFKAVKGNGSIPVFNVSFAEVLWESFGTSIAPYIGEMIAGVCYKENYVAFQTSDTFKEGNAVIALKDASGNILWSWHIWFTDQPKGQVYYNNAGTMMDRNLGATSATPGDVGALGLLYRWGYKEPFLGSSSISGNELAVSTVPVAYKDQGWYWTTSGEDKLVYDPCPAGWRVPDGGENGVWAKALGSTSSYTETYDSVNEGMNFSGIFGDDDIIWYPAAGYRNYSEDVLRSVGVEGWYASSNTWFPNCLLCLSFKDSGMVNPLGCPVRAEFPVRCIKE